MRLHDIRDVNDLKDMSSNDVVDLLDELRAIAPKRGTELVQQGRVQARKALGAPEPGAVGGALLFGLVLGAAVGAIAAALWTPMAGREARRRLAAQAEQMKERMPEMSHSNGRPAVAPEMASPPRSYETI